DLARGGSETQRRVGGAACGVVELVVGGDLPATVPLRPVDRGIDEGAPEPAPAEILIDVPPLDISHRARAATGGDRAKRGLDEPAKLAVAAIDDEHLRSQPADEALLVVFVDLGWQIRAAVGPEREAHARPLVVIRRVEGSNA